MILNIEDINRIYSYDPHPRYSALLTQFQVQYKSQPDFISRAPGRLNIIGGHIDFVGFGVFTAASQKDCLIACRKIQGKQIYLKHMKQQTYPSCEVPVDPNVEWKFINNYVKYFRGGYRAGTKDIESEELTGMQILIEGNIPVAAGLSSSSAFCVCVALAALQANGYHGQVETEVLIKRCIEGENETGTVTGGQDQSTSLMGKNNSCLHINFKPHIKGETIEFPTNYRFIVMNSMVQSAKLINAVYRINKRVCEYRLALEVLSVKLQIHKETKIGWKIFKDLHQWSKLPINNMKNIVEEFLTQKQYTREEIEEITGKHIEIILEGIPLSDKVVAANKVYNLKGPAKHAFTEAQRVNQFMEICKSNLNDHSKCILLGKLMNESLLSDQLDYNCSCPEIDELTALGKKYGALGIRISGAGWGGFIVTLVEAEHSRQFINNICEEYYFKKLQLKQKVEKIGIQNIIFETKASEGACIITI